MLLVYLCLLFLSVNAVFCTDVYTELPDSYKTVSDGDNRKARQFFGQQSFPSFPSFPNFPSYHNHPSYPSSLTSPSYPQYPAFVASSASFPVGSSWLGNPLFVNWLQSIAASAQGGSLPSLPLFPEFPQRPQIAIIDTNASNQSGSSTTEQSSIPEITTQTPEHTTTEAPKYTVASMSMYNCPRPGAFEHSDNCVQFYRCFEYVPGSLNGILYRCPTGYAFSPKHERCLKEANLPTCKKNILKKKFQEKAVSKEEFEHLMSLVV